MSPPRVRKIALMASHDWTLRAAMREFLEFLDPVLRWDGHEYRIELTRAEARPLKAGEDLSRDADLILDRTSHWSSYYRSWAHQAANSQARMVNHPYSFAVYDKHSTYDLMARAIHPADRFPVTVLLPLYSPWTEDQIRQYWWEKEQKLLIEHTRLGFDSDRSTTDWQELRTKLELERRTYHRERVIRQHFYAPGDYLRETVERDFGGRFPLYLKKAYGGGGSQVWKVRTFEELFQRYDQTGDQAFHLQEAVEPYDVFYRCMGVGPIVFPMVFQPDHPHHEHYSPEKPVVDPEVFRRLESYVLFINAYHRWTYNSFECLLADGRLHPIDFANACPDSHFTSLHVHFPLLVCSLVKWLSFCAVTGKDMGPDIEMTRTLTVLNDPEIPSEEKFEFCRRTSEEYFEVPRFEDFCQENFPGIEERMVEFVDQRFDDLIRFAMEYSDFPEDEQESFYQHYKGFMDGIWRPRAAQYLQPVITG